MRRSKLGGYTAVKVAVIDMGTNTFHLIVAAISDGKYNLIHRERRAVKIGEKGINKGEITPEGAERAIQTMKDFRKVLDRLEVDYVQATATSAFRNAKNGKEVADRIFGQSKIAPNIISGMEEAELIYQGVKEALDIGSAPAMIMDIGGGSIEVIIGNHDKILWKQSFEIGGQRLLEKFHQHDPISNKEQQDLERYLDTSLEELIAKADNLKPTVLIGSSGTFDTLSDIYLHSINQAPLITHTERPLSMDGFQRIFEDLIRKTRQERLLIPGMIEMRVDMIVVASILVSFVINKLQIDQIRVSTYALKEGLLMQMIQDHQVDQ